MAKTVTIISILCNLRGRPAMINPVPPKGEDLRTDACIAGRGYAMD